MNIPYLLIISINYIFFRADYFVTMKDKGLFAFAGIWDWWKSPSGEAIVSCSIITTDANSLINKIHDRMPVIIQRESFGTWLNPANSEIGLKQYMQPFSPYKMTTYPVSNMVNSPQNDSPACIKRSLQ
jgi:putative SOS response-associated peptidase YedK